MTMLDGVRKFAANAAFVLAVGTCASFGGIPGGAPDPTGAVGVSEVVNGKPIVNIPGCPPNPDWVVGTVAYIIANGAPPALDGDLRPKDYYGKAVHTDCPRRQYADKGNRSKLLGEAMCLRKLGCRGPETGADCPTRQWHSPAQGVTGVNWCIGAGAPCHGCTEAGFPDEFSPFYTLEEALGKPGKDMAYDDSVQDGLSLSSLRSVT